MKRTYNAVMDPSNMTKRRKMCREFRRGIHPHRRGVGWGLEPKQLARGPGSFALARLGNELACASALR
jgi:uncharacterized protein (UPF0548 family)